MQKGNSIFRKQTPFATLMEPTMDLEIHWVPLVIPLQRKRKKAQIQLEKGINKVLLFSNSSFSMLRTYSWAKQLDTFFKILKPSEAVILIKALFLKPEKYILFISTITL